MEKLESRSSVSGTATSPKTSLIEWHDAERGRVSREATECRFPQLRARFQAAERFHRDSGELVRRFQQDLLPYQMERVHD